MDTRIKPAVDALVAGISEFLGEPFLRQDKMIHWKKGEFEVAVQRDAGPHVWISTMWRPEGAPFSPIADRIEIYDKGQKRHSGLRVTKWLGENHRARRISNVGDVVPTVLNVLRACADIAVRP